MRTSIILCDKCGKVINEPFRLHKKARGGCSSVSVQVNKYSDGFWTYECDSDLCEDCWWSRVNSWLGSIGLVLKEKEVDMSIDF